MRNVDILGAITPALGEMISQLLIQLGVWRMRQVALHNLPTFRVFLEIDSGT